MLLKSISDIRMFTDTLLRVSVFILAVMFLVVIIASYGSAATLYTDDTYGYIYHLNSTDNTRTVEDVTGTTVRYTKLTPLYSYSVGVVSNSTFDGPLPLAQIGFTIGRQTNLLLGRLGNDQGFYNDVLSTPSSQMVAIPPMGVYNRQHTAASWLVYDGLLFRYSRECCVHGVEVTAGYGVPVTTNQQMLNDVFFRYSPPSNTKMQPQALRKASVKYVYNWKHTVLYQYYSQDIQATVGVDATPFDMWIQQEPDVTLTAHFIGYKYHSYDWEVQAEAFRLRTDHILSFGSTGGYKESYGYYAQVAYNWNHFTLFSGYTYSPGEIRREYRNTSNIPHAWTYGQDTWLGFSWRLGRGMYLGVEHHFMRGLSWTHEKTLDTPTEWNFTVTTLTYTF